LPNLSHIRRDPTDAVRMYPSQIRYCKIIHDRGGMFWRNSIRFGYSFDICMCLTTKSWLCDRWVFRKTWSQSGLRIGQTDGFVVSLLIEQYRASRHEGGGLQLGMTPIAGIRPRLRSSFYAISWSTTSQAISHTEAAVDTPSAESNNLHESSIREVWSRRSVELDAHSEFGREVRSGLGHLCRLQPHHQHYTVSNLATMGFS
jgi:hypothetical protein